MNELPNVAYAALVGLDWSDCHHDLCASVQGKTDTRNRRIGSDPEALHSFFLELHAETGGGRIAVCLEQSRGPVVYGLMPHAFIDIYPVNPLQMKRYREAFCPSGAKDDARDAALMLDILKLHRDRLRCWKADEPEIRELRLLCEDRRGFVDQRSRALNQMRSVLKLYYPQALEVAGDDLASEMFCAFLMKWPSYESFSAARDQTVRAFLYSHNLRSESRVAKVLEVKSNSRSLTSDRAVVDSCLLRIQSLVRMLRVLNQTIKDYDGKIGLVFTELPDAEIFAELPGAGAQLAPRMLALYGTDRGRFASACEVSTYVGVAPVIASSGKKSWTHWRWNCPSFLRQTMVEYARCSIGQSQWAAAYYHHLRQKGKGHQAALRALAFKWSRIIFRCWMNRTKYDESRYIASLKSKGVEWAAKLE